MNQTMGWYINSLDVEGRDRLVAAPGFSDGAWWDGSCGCLVGTACDMGRLWSETHAVRLREDATCRPWGERQRDKWVRSSRPGSRTFVWASASAAFRYPMAVCRFGLPRVVRAIKLRAARLNGCDPATIRAIVEAPAHV